MTSVRLSHRRAALRTAALYSGLLAACVLGSPAHAANAIYVSTAANGLPSYTQEPTEPGSTLYLVLSDPTPRRKPPRLDSLRLDRRAASAPADAGLIDPSIRRLVDAAARAHDVPPALLFAVMHAESHFDPAARSSAGAVGLMQIMPPTGLRYGVSHGLDDPANNIDVGTRYLKDLLELFKGDEALAVAAYNAGEGAVLKHGGRIPPYRETRAYVPRVLGLYADYARQSPVAALRIRQAERAPVNVNISRR